MVALVAASAALTLSGVPFMGPIGAARVGVIDGEYVLNPTLEQIKASDLDLVVAGTANAVLMVESEAKELTEEKMLGAVTFGQRGFQPVIDAIIRLAERGAKEPRDFVPPTTLLCSTGSAASSRPTCARHMRSFARTSGAMLSTRRRRRRWWPS